MKKILLPTPTLRLICLSSQRGLTPTESNQDRLSPKQLKTGKGQQVGLFFLTSHPIHHCCPTLFTWSITGAIGWVQAGIVGRGRCWVGCRVTYIKTRKVLLRQGKQQQQQQRRLLRKQNPSYLLSFHFLQRLFHRAFRLSRKKSLIP